MTGTAADRDVRVVLLAGGKGTRFWPASRASRPKQFLRLFGDRSLLRLTFERFARFVTPDRIHVVTGEAHADRVRAEIPEVPRENLMLEPSGKDTAPAIAWAARELRRHGSDTVLVIAPTDHYIQDDAAFLLALHAGVGRAREGALVTFGIVPDRPATGYGYIEAREDPAGGTGNGLSVVRFREKPDAEEAAAFLAAGGYYWNAGIFAWRIDSFERELAAAAPELSEGIASLPPASPRGEKGDERFARAWEGLAPRSIDYALMEKASSVVCVPLAAGWSDVGNWDAALDLLQKDTDGNVPDPDVLFLGARGCSVHRWETSGGSPGDTPRRLYVLVGTRNLMIVEAPDAVLVCPSSAGETLREVVRSLESRGRKDLL